MPDSSRSAQLTYIGALTIIVLGLYFSSFYSYLLFHSLIEITTIAVAFTLFILTLNTHQYQTNSYLNVLGIGYAFIALIDLLHTLAYKGMGVFTGYGANLPTQLWIAARYLQAVTLLAAPLVVARRVNTHTIIGSYAIAVSVFVAMVYSENFPDCFIEGKGLTAFKLGSEYVITALLLVALYLFYGKRKAFNPRVFLLIAASITCTAFSEIAFTTYVSVYGFANLVGHFAKLAAFYLVYRAILVTGLKDPFDLTFRDLKHTEEALRKSHDTLEEKVRERTVELRTSEARYRSLVRKVQTAIVLHDGQGQLLNSNPLAHELLGLSEDQLLGKSLIDPEWHFLREDGTIMPVAEYPVSIVLSSQRALRGYVTGISCPDKDDISWVLVNAEPEYDDTGKVSLVIVSFVDITKRKHAEEELKRHRDHLEELVRERTAELVEAKERAEAANRAKSIFLANMSHELRTPLNAVLGFAQLMRVAPDATEQQVENLDIIIRSGEYLLNLINNILDISKIESGHVLLEESATDLHQLLHEMRSLMYVKAKEKGLDFTVEQSPDFPRNANVDSGKLRQVLINLIGNAVKYTKTGGIIIHSKVVKWETPQSARIRFEVKDSGSGIRAEDVGHIFQPFTQLAGQPFAEAGTGLGLAICKQYVELMGGRLGVTSEPGMGSVFCFEIPVAVLPAAEIPAEPRHGRVIGLKEGQPRYRLLIVEDQPENRLLLYKLLEPLGFELRETANGQEAVEISEQWHPDLIWMDVRMPVMDGREATRRIKQTEACAHTRIIALTAHALEEERREIMAAGCDGFIRKPYKQSDIFEALTRNLGVQFVYEEETAPAAGAEQVDAAALVVLPPELLNTLVRALSRIDIGAVNQAVEDIRTYNESLAEALAALAKDLQFGRMLRMVRAARGEAVPEDETCIKK